MARPQLESSMDWPAIRPLWMEGNREGGTFLDPFVHSFRMEVESSKCYAQKFAGYLFL